MAELVHAHDLTAASQDGWVLDYLIRREDGEELHAEVRCWNRARVAAQGAGNSSALEAILIEASPPRSRPPSSRSLPQREGQW